MRIKIRIKKRIVKHKNAHTHKNTDLRCVGPARVEDVTERETAVRFQTRFQYAEENRLANFH